jgi:hypothetical protein
MKKMLTISAVLSLSTMAASKADDELIAWTVALETAIPAAVPNAPQAKPQNLEFMVRFFALEKPLYLLLYDTISFRVSDEAGRQLEPLEGAAMHRPEVPCLGLAVSGSQVLHRRLVDLHIVVGRYTFLSKLQRNSLSLLL